MIDDLGAPNKPKSVKLEGAPLSGAPLAIRRVPIYRGSCLFQAQGTRGPCPSDLARVVFSGLEVGMDSFTGLEILTLPMGQKGLSLGIGVRLWM